jgi:hypothetical protein
MIATTSPILEADTESARSRGTGALGRGKSAIGRRWLSALVVRSDDEAVRGRRGGGRRATGSTIRALWIQGRLATVAAALFGLLRRLHRDYKIFVFGRHPPRSHKTHKTGGQLSCFAASDIFDVKYDFR